MPTHGLLSEIIVLYLTVTLDNQVVDLKERLV